MRFRLETGPAASVACRRAEGAELASKGKGYRTVEFEGFLILVGKADADNDRLTFGIAEPRDFWLHVAGPAGSHVVVRNPLGLEELPRPVAERAAQLAAWHSKARGARGKVEVHLCRVADVRKPRGFAPGQVLLKRWAAVRVYPRGQEDEEPEGE
jgi:predicted ribosome quality control (RQC) complex YloA/Tae2 family protein